MSRPLLVIGNKNYSSWSLRPWLLMRHHGIDFEERLVPLGTPAFHAAIARLSPSRKVPALHDGDLVVWDSLAICEYVNERWLDGAGWPTGRADRALARSVSAEMHSGFAVLRNQLPMNCRRKPDGYRWGEAAQADIDRVLALWAELLAREGRDGEFLFGRFGIVDAMFAPVVMRFVGYGVPAGGAAGEYMDAVRTLPAMREWVAAAAAEPDVIEANEKRG